MVLETPGRGEDLGAIRTGEFSFFVDVQNMALQSAPRQVVLVTIRAWKF